MLSSENITAKCNSIKTFINECVQSCFGSTRQADTSTTQPILERSFTMLETAVVNLAQCGQEADLATVLISIVIPHLTKLLKDNDQMVVNLAANMIYQFSKKEATKIAVANSPQIIPMLIEATKRTGGLEIQRRTAGVFYNLSQTQEGLILIFESRNFGILVEFLSSPMESIQFYTLGAIHNLLLKQDGSTIAFLQNGVVPVLCNLLKSNHVKFLAMATDCLRILAFNNTECKLIMLDYKAHVQLLRIISMHTFELLLWTTAQTLSSLSTCHKSKMAIVEKGGIHILRLHLDHQSERVVRHCLLTLTNISDCGLKENVDGLLEKMVSWLESRQEDFVICAASILKNLTFSNRRNVEIVRGLGGVDALVNVIKKARDCKEIMEPAMTALRHLIGYEHRLIGDLFDANALIAIAGNSETIV